MPNEALHPTAAGTIVSGPPLIARPFWNSPVAQGSVPFPRPAAVVYVFRDHHSQISRLAGVGSRNVAAQSQGLRLGLFHQLKGEEWKVPKG